MVLQHLPQLLQIHHAIEVAALPGVVRHHQRLAQGVEVLLAPERVGDVAHHPLQLRLRLSLVLRVLDGAVGIVDDGHKHGEHHKDNNHDVEVEQQHRHRGVGRRECLVVKHPQADLEQRAQALSQPLERRHVRTKGDVKCGAEAKQHDRRHDHEEDELEPRARDRHHDRVHLGQVLDVLEDLEVKQEEVERQQVELRGGKLCQRGVVDVERREGALHREVVDDDDAGHAYTDHGQDQNIVGPVYVVPGILEVHPPLLPHLQDLRQDVVGQQRQQHNLPA
mmetsp:Transcript_20639/g.53977  ORF Transcript_20639/g.53977 Transcript_20639/m.53977 type:complete len:279 (-) Transcript_20639:173-1009(-)